MTHLPLANLLCSLTLVLSACSGDNYDPGAAPSSVNLPSDANLPGPFSAQRAYPALAFAAPVLIRAVPAERRLVVAEQGGRVLAFSDTEASKDKKPVLDISSRVLFAGEQGLLGLAFDPGFSQNRLLYLNYSAAEPRRNIISRMRWDPETDTIDPGSEKILLEIEQPWSNHNGGSIEFGPDGFLYIGVGDGGRGGDPRNYAQNRGSLLGKMLRIDVHPAERSQAYQIPPDNPFVDEPGVRPEIYALGLRNPFRFSFDRESGLLWLADVGQNTVEEIDIIEAGGNYGWRVYEGSQPYEAEHNTLPDSAFTPPVFEYSREQGVSVTGGIVYRGNRVDSLHGRYLYADYGSGRVWALSWDGDKVTASTYLTSVDRPTDFAHSSDGELLILSRAGVVFRISD